MRSGALILLAAGFLACHDNPTEPSSDREPISAVRITAPQRTLSPGDSIRLTVQVLDSLGRVLPNQPVTWTSSSPAVAHIDATGLLTADSVGATTIVAAARGKRGSVDFTVNVTALCDCLSVLDSAAVRLIARNDSTGVYVFEVLRGPPPVIDSGQIIAGAQGYLRRVVHSSTQGSQITVQTSIAYLEEAVGHGAFAITSPVGDSLAVYPGVGTSPGTRWGAWATTYQAPGLTQKRDNLGRVSWDLSSLPAFDITFKNGGELTFEIKDGDFDFDPQLDLGAEFGFFELLNAHAIFRGNVGLNLNDYEVTIKKLPNFTDSTRKAQPDSSREDKPLYERSRLFLSWIGILPVFGRVVQSVKLEIEPEVSVEAAFSGAFHAGFGLWAGVRYDKDRGVYPDFGTSSYFNATPPAFSITGSASLKISLKPEYYIELYFVGGPFVNLEAYAEAKATAAAVFDFAAPPPFFSGLDWEALAEAGLNLNIGGRLSLLGAVKEIEASYPFPLLGPYRLIQAWSDGPLVVQNTTAGADFPADFGLELQPDFTPTDATFGRNHETSYQSKKLPVNGRVTLNDIRSGPDYPHLLNLAQSNMQGNCSVTGFATDTVQINSQLMISLGGDTARASFSADCIALGDLQAGTVSTGPDQPPQDAIIVQRLDRVGTGKGDSAITIGIPGGTADTVLEDFIPRNPRNGATGLLRATLVPGRRNCATARPGFNDVVIESGDTVTTRFLVTCVALGHIRALTTTTDLDPAPISDSVRFAPRVVPLGSADPVPPLPDSVIAGAPVLVSGLVPLYNASGASGSYVVSLMGAPNRCRENGQYQRPVTVFAGDTAVADFMVTCVERLHVRTLTTGPGTDVDGYQLVIDGADTVSVGIDAVVPIAGVLPGDHVLHLADVEPSCTAPADILVSVSGRDSTLAGFAVDCPAPPPPDNLHATEVDTNRIDLAWDPAVADSVFRIYRIYRNGALYDSSTTPSFSDVGLAPFTSFSYQVATVNLAGLEGARSISVGARTLDTPPGVPAGLSATAAGSATITLAWNPAADPESGVAGYNIYRDGILLISTTATGFTDTGLDPVTTYGYEVSAVNGAGLEGLRSSPAFATTEPLPPSGELEVVTLTGGYRIPPGYVVRVEGNGVNQVQPIASSGRVTFAGLLPGTYAVELETVPVNCTVSAPNSRLVTLPANSGASTAFQVTCQQ